MLSLPRSLCSLGKPNLMLTYFVGIARCMCNPREVDAVLEWYLLRWYSLGVHTLRSTSFRFRLRCKPQLTSGLLMYWFSSQASFHLRMLRKLGSISFASQNNSSLVSLASSSGSKRTSDTLWCPSWFANAHVCNGKRRCMCDPIMILAVFCTYEVRHPYMYLWNPIMVLQRRYIKDISLAKGSALCLLVDTFDVHNHNHSQSSACLGIITYLFLYLWYIINTYCNTKYKENRL